MSEDGELTVPPKADPWSVVRCNESIEKGTLHPVPCTLYLNYWLLTTGLLDSLFFFTDT